MAAYRQVLGLTLEVLAARLEVNPRTVRSWESGRDPISDGAADDLLDLVDEHEKLSAQMIDAGVATVERRAIDGGWSLGAAARALGTSPDLEVNWREQRPMRQR